MTRKVTKRRKGIFIALWTTKDVKSALNRAAENETRNLANMAEYILANWLREKGYLKDAS